MCDEQAIDNTNGVRRLAEALLPPGELAFDISEVLVKVNREVDPGLPVSLLALCRENVFIDVNSRQPSINEKGIVLAIPDGDPREMLATYPYR